MILGKIVISDFTPVASNAIIKGQAKLLNGTTDPQYSGFHFSKSGGRVVSWFSASPGADILAIKGGPLVTFFLPHEGGAQPTPAAFSGIVRMDAHTLDEVDQCPSDDEKYDVQWYDRAAKGGVYCVRCRDGRHYAGIIVTEVSDSAIHFDWKYQSGERNKFK
jgi:hypothetical protein